LWRRLGATAVLWTGIPRARISASGGSIGVIDVRRIIPEGAEIRNEITVEASAGKVFAFTFGDESPRPLHLLPDPVSKAPVFEVPRQPGVFVFVRARGIARGQPTCPHRFVSRRVVLRRRSSRTSRPHVLLKCV
jgi:hypothetical protein